MNFAIGPGLNCDLDELMISRLLVQANSGAGKSWALRRILEQTFGQTQQFVFDRDGEFVSLREKFDYVLAAKHGGDTPAEARSAKLLARRLLEIGASAILDISELGGAERVLFIRYFLEAMIDAPKALWHSCLVVIDEVEQFCPEGSTGTAESAKAVEDLMLLGRKRGYCGILATKRLARLRKSAAYECNNKLIGRCMLDDAKRAADELGFPGRDGWQQFRELDRGEFFAFGPALSREAQRVRVGTIQTTHPEAGQGMRIVVPPPSAKVRALLPKLGDLPAEAEHERKTLEDLKRDNANLRRDLTLAKKAQPPSGPPDEAVIERRITSAITARDREHTASLRAASGYTNKLERVIKDTASTLGGLAERLQKAVNGRDMIEPKPSQLGGEGRERPSSPTRPRLLPTPPPAPVAASMPAALGELDAGARKMLLELAARHPLTWTQAQLGTLCGYAHTKSTYRTYRSRLTSRDLIGITGDDVSITGAGLALVGNAIPDAPLDHASAMALWRSKLDKGAYAMLAAVVEAGSEGLTEDEMAERSGYDRETSTYRTYRSRLTSRGLVIISGGCVVATDVLFPEG